MLGLEILPLVSNVVVNCARNLPFNRLLDLCKIMMLSVETFKTDSIALLDAAIPIILSKAFETPAP